MRERTSLSQANGLTVIRWQEATKLRSTSGRVAAMVAAKEHPVVAADCHTADGALGGVVIDLHSSVLAVARQRRPVFQRVTHRQPLRALRQHFCLDFQ